MGLNLCSAPALASHLGLRLGAGSPYTHTCPSRAQRPATPSQRPSWPGQGSEPASPSFSGLSGEIAFCLPLELSGGSCKSGSRKHRSQARQYTHTNPVPFPQRGLCQAMSGVDGHSRVPAQGLTIPMRGVSLLLALRMHVRIKNSPPPSQQSCWNLAATGEARQEARPAQEKKAADAPRTDRE
jgi:hypothetical protein